MSLTDRIKAEARRLGFQLVGVTTPDPPPHFDVFESWLGAGRHGQMGYLATERARSRRSDPRQILPECRSILVLGMRYPSPELLHYPQNGERGSRTEGHQYPVSSSYPEQPPPSHPRGEPNDPGSQSPAVPMNHGIPRSRQDGPAGRAASYAWGDDYHHVFPPRLQALVDFIETQVGEPVPNRWYTDTGPILERELAQRAGLGWIGKNTCLISPTGGSYFLLAEVLLGLALEPDPPFVPDHCGSCTRCLEACPTQCILPDRTIDAAKCISYLTIELKGPIPSDLRPKIGNWVFGCDICQQVCPWNERFADREDSAPDLADPAFYPRPGLPAPDLIRELALTPQEFSQKFRRSPVKRARRSGHARNVAVALGNSGEHSAVPALAQALLEDPEPLVRAHAAWALGRIGGSDARQVLLRAAGCETAGEVLQEIHAALGELESQPR